MGLFLKLKEPDVDKVREFLSGKKTYLLLMATIIGTVVAWVEGKVDTMQGIYAIIAALAGMTLRAGVTSNAKSNGKSTP